MTNLPEARPDAGRAHLRYTVTPDDTARALGSGEVEALATPRLLAWCEAATCAAVAPLPEGSTSVGTRVVLDHVLPSRVGAVVTVEATLAETEGRLRRVLVEASDEQGRRVGGGEVTRVVVDRETFVQRLG